MIYVTLPLFVLPYCASLVWLIRQSSVYRQRTVPFFHWTFRRVLVVAGVLSLVGMVSEYLQKFSGRSPGWADVLANTSGIAVAAIWIHSRRKKGWNRMGLAGLSFGVLVVVSAPSAFQLWDCIQQIRSFPLLGSFERPYEIDGWTPHRSTIEQSTEWASHGEHSLKLTLSTGRYPGVGLLWFESGWNDYRSLCLDLKNPNSKPLALVIKVYDRRHWDSDFDHRDRFQREVILPPDSQKAVVLDLADIKAAPTDRTMDLDDIVMIDIFSVGVESQTDCYIDNVRLERNQ